MNVRHAAQETFVKGSRNYVGTVVRDPLGRGVGHQLWLLNEIIDGFVTGEKAHRWLGWAQAALTYEGMLTLDACKHINKLT